MDEEKFIDPRYLEELRKYSASGHKDNDDAMALTMAGERYRKEFEMQPVLDGKLPKFCKAHHCTERGPKCDRCAYTALSSSERGIWGA